jgi:hypothetical protein
MVLGNEANIESAIAKVRGLCPTNSRNLGTGDAATVAVVDPPQWTATAEAFSYRRNC